MYMTAMISVRAIKVRPIAPYVSKSVKKYSPAPVVNIKPIDRQKIQAIPKINQLIILIIHIIKTIIRLNQTKIQFVINVVKKDI